MKCPRCGSEYPDAFNHCPVCGAGNELNGSMPDHKESDADKKLKSMKKALIALGCAGVLACGLFAYLGYMRGKNTGGSVLSAIAAQSVDSVEEGVSSAEDAATAGTSGNTAAMTISASETAIATSTPIPTENIITSTPIPTEQPVTAAPTPTKKASVTTPIPTENTDTEATIRLPDGDTAPRSEFIFPDSSDSYLTSSDLERMNSGDLSQMHFQSQMAINEIYVRYGYVFTGTSDSAAAARDKYSAETWYTRAQHYCPSNDSSELLHNYMNIFEKENIKAINDWQKSYGIYY